MTVKMTEVVMKVPLPGGGFCWVVFDPTVTPDFAPIHVLNSARMAQPNAPLFLKPLKENGAGAPLLHSAPLPSHEWRKPSPSGEFLGFSKETKKTSKTTPQEDLLLAREIISDLASDLAVLDNELAPVRAEERDIREEILSSHDETSTGVVILDLSNRRERRKLFGRLDTLAEKWGKKKEQRRRLNSQVKSLEKQIQQLERIISKERKKA